MSDPLAQYVEKEFRKGISAGVVRGALLKAGYELEHVESTMYHVRKKWLHIRMIFIATVVVMSMGMFLIESNETSREWTGGNPEQAGVLLSESAAYKRISAETPVPKTMEECFGYRLELQRRVCLEKYETWTPVLYGKIDEPLQ